MAVFMAVRSFPPRFTGKMPSFFRKKPSSGMRNSWSLAMTVSRASFGRFSAIKMGSQPLAWLAHSSAPSSGKSSNPTVRQGNSRWMMGAAMA